MSPSFFLYTEKVEKHKCDLIITYRNISLKQREMNVMSCYVMSYFLYYILFYKIRYIVHIHNSLRTFIKVCLVIVSSLGLLFTIVYQKSTMNKLSLTWLVKKDMLIKLLQISIVKIFLGTHTFFMQSCSVM